MFHLFVVIKFSFFFSKEIKASELLKDPEKLKHIPHQLSSPEKDKQRKCLNYIQLLIISFDSKCNMLELFQHFDSPSIILCQEAFKSRILS